jgi:hypothetical protein
MDINKIFIGGKMNKSLDERFIPKGEYLHAENIRINSDETGEAGIITTALGKNEISDFGFGIFNKCIGAFADEQRDTIYWFVTTTSGTKTDYIVSYNTRTGSQRTHLRTLNVLNFDESYPINDITLIDDLLFFTDNYNQPRRINVNKTYELSTGVDNITEDDISVIVKPPIESPQIELIKTTKKDNYIEDKFIRFAYRYKYENGEYSALSEFSDLAFDPRGFQVDYRNYNMKGMQNEYNSVNLTINTGSKRVVGVDVCFKLSNSNVVNVVDKYTKEDEGWTDNDEVTLVFNNQKIYTTLPESELLRLYDNVPKKAKSQTSIGNRIMYGNYVDGHDVGVKIDYTAELNSEDIGLQVPEKSNGNGDSYTLDTATTIDNCTLVIDFDGIEMKKDGAISISVGIDHSAFGGSSSYSGGPENTFRGNFDFVFQRNYYSAQELAEDTQFLSKINSSLPISQASEGNSLKDLFYSAVTPKSGWELIGAGVATDDENFLVSYSGNSLTIQIPSLKFREIANPTVYAYEYLLYSTSDVDVYKVSKLKSLHSNRDYELGIVYLDEYNRASTVLTSKDNTINVPADSSTSLNSIRTTITNKAPSWAKRYRFALKTNKGPYDTIYSNLFFYDSSQSSWWCKLEGDNQTKAKKGDSLILKTSASGPEGKLIKTKILDLDVKESNFLNNEEPTGVYMKIKPRGFSLSSIDNPIIGYGTSGKDVQNKDIVYSTSEENPDYTVGGSELQYKEYKIPAGSVVRFEIITYQKGDLYSRFEFERSFVALSDYDNMYDFIIGENIDFNLPTNDPGTESAQGKEVEAVWINTVGTYSDFSGEVTGFEHQNLNITDPVNLNSRLQVRYYRNSITGEACLGFSNPQSFYYDNTFLISTTPRNAYMNVDIEVVKSGGLLVLETTPAESDNEIYYESNTSYPIDENGFHQGDVQSQTASQNAVVDVNMYNCFSFGNGVESFKINDELATPGFNIGARVTAVSEEDYKEAHRYADITYSGIYNEDTNINKLNEFNLGLTNFSVLEKSFGSIEKMHARTGDILVFQEDKISTVLANGKNLFSDASAGGAIISTPDVLGQQIPRLEEYGISNNPESFASFGYDVFFTDTKRGAVINLRGDQLNVISNDGMGSWFRDEFITSKNKIKLGAFDNYTKEYVLAVTDTEMPEPVNEIECGTEITRRNANDTINYKVNLNHIVGTYDVDYTVTSGSITIVATYNDVEVKNETFTSSGTFSLSKDLLNVNELEISITAVVADYSLLVGCVQAQSLTIISITKNHISREGKTIHHEFTWNDASIQGTTQESFIQINEGPVSNYSSTTGVESFGPIPLEGATVTMRSIKESGDSLVFISDRFKYLVSDTLYYRYQINDLYPLLQSSGAITNPSTGVYESSFTYNNTSNHQYLYLVWEYVDSGEAQDLPPVITLLGPNPYNIVTNDPYNEYGATVIDPEEGDVSDNLVIDDSAVNTSVAGTYSVAYNASDDAGNPADEVTRSVVVAQAVNNYDKCRNIYVPDTSSIDPSVDVFYYTQGGVVVSIDLDQTLATDELNGTTYHLCSSTIPQIGYSGGPADNLPVDVTVTTSGNCTNNFECSL